VNNEDMQHRRRFLGGATGWLGGTALHALGSAAAPGLGTHFPGQAKQIIYLFMSGGPSHVDLFDEKPELTKRDGQPIPESIVDGVHFAAISRQSGRPKLKASPFQFARHGASGLPISELMPHLARVADKLTVVKSVHSSVFNHDPAVNLVNTGDSRVGRPTMGAWISYGLGNLTENLPTYIVLTSGQKRQPLLTSYWSNGFLPTEHQGVEFRNSGDPILFLSNPPEVTRGQRRQQLDLLQRLNRKRLQAVNDPEIAARIQQFELAFRMQAAAPRILDVRHETAQTLAMYGVDQNRPSFARNCLLARRLVEHGVRFVQLYDMGWDSHGSLVAEHRQQCRGIDQGVAALLTDLEQRGLLEETLVIWGGEFGRTPVAEGSGQKWGRDHHPHGFTMWMAGGGMRPGTAYGNTDVFGFHAEQNAVDIHDVHATILHCLGIDHEQMTYRHQGRDFRLTDVSGEVIPELLA
jgi:hypothetical protein